MFSSTAGCCTGGRRELRGHARRPGCRSSSACKAVIFLALARSALARASLGVLHRPAAPYWLRSAAPSNPLSALPLWWFRHIAPSFVHPRSSPVLAREHASLLLHSPPCRPPPLSAPLRLDARWPALHRHPSTSLMLADGHPPCPRRQWHILVLEVARAGTFG